MKEIFPAEIPSSQVALICLVDKNYDGDTTEELDRDELRLCTWPEQRVRPLTTSEEIYMCVFVVK